VNALEAGKDLLPDIHRQKQNLIRFGYKVIPRRRVEYQTDYLSQFTMSKTTLFASKQRLDKLQGMMILSNVSM